MRILSEFFSVVASTWVFLMSGSASVCIAVWLRIKRRPNIAAAPFWAIAAVCLVVALFLAWRAEWMGRMAAESTVQEMATPRLEGSIEMIDVGHLEHTGELQSAVLVWLRIRNQGADSIAEGYRLQIVVDGKEIGRWIPSRMPRNIHFRDFGGTSVLEAGSGSIYEKTVDRAIPRGNQVKGLLMFVIEGFEMNSLTRNAVTFNILFHDVKDRICIASHVMTGDLYSQARYPFYLPGTPGFQSEGETNFRRRR